MNASKPVARRRGQGLRAVMAVAFALAVANCGLTEARAAIPSDSLTEQGLLCRSAVRQAEAGHDLPQHLLAGIARVESGLSDPVTGRVHPWPWSINTEGQDHIFNTKADAIAFARALQARGVRSFDAGCLQVNLMYHPDAFQTLEEAFDPVANARYAVKFLTELRDKSGSWETASAWYHSADPAKGAPYRDKVVSAMADEARNAGLYDNTVPVFGSATTFAARPTAARALPSAPQGGPTPSGAAMTMAGAPRGMTIGRNYAGLASANVLGSAAGGSVLVGRGLDAYRMRPVVLVGQRVIAAR